MGYVAELQQFDPVPPAVYELTAPEPATEIIPAAAPPAHAPRGSHAVNASAQSYMRHLDRRRTRAAVIACAALAVLVGVGLGYVGLAEGSPSARAGAPAAGTSGGPGEGPRQLDPAVPGVDPVTGAVTTAAVGATPVAGKTSGAGLADATPGGTTSPARPGVIVPTYVLPGVPESAPTTDPVSADPTSDPALPLTATLTHVADLTDEGFLGYAGTVRIDNPGGQAVTGWRVTLTVLGANVVDGSGVSVAQDGESVVFTPSGDGTVPAGGSVSFSFDVLGTLLALPVGCAIDGNPCS